MAPLSSLEPQHRAVLSLVLAKGKTYAEIAALLDLGLPTVRARAHQALDALAPPAGPEPPPGPRASIADYLLGQEPDRAPATLAYLESSPAARAWARALAPALAGLAADGLPAIPPEPDDPRPTPTAGAEPAPPAAAVDPAPPAAAPPAAVDPAPPAEVPPAGAEPAAKAPPDPAPARPAQEPPVAATTGPDPDPPPIEDAAPPPTPAVSRRGGLVLILGAVAAIAALVVGGVVLLGGGSAPRRTTGSQPAATTPARLIAQITLTPSPGEPARAFAAVIQRGTQRVIAIAASGLQPTTTQRIYGAWLYNSPTDFQLVGYVPQVKADGKVSAAAPLPAGAARFHEFLVTRSTAAASSRPGAIMLRGAIPAGAAG